MDFHTYWPIVVLGTLGLAVKVWAFWGARVRHQPPTEAEIDRDLRDFQP